MNISSLLLSLSFARLSGPLSFSLTGVAAVWSWDSYSPGPSQLPLSPLPFSPSTPPPFARCRCLCLPLPACAPLLGSSTPPAACSGLRPWDRELWLKIPFLPLSWMCLVCVSFPRVREDAWGCAGMNFGRGAYVPQKTVSVFLHPTFPSTSSSVSFI